MGMYFSASNSQIYFSSVHLRKLKVFNRNLNLRTVSHPKMFPQPIFLYPPCLRYGRGMKTSPSNRTANKKRKIGEGNVKRR